MKIIRIGESAILERVVNRKLTRRESRSIVDLVVDETFFQKRLESLTMFMGWDSGTIMEILDDRKKITLKEWLEQSQEWVSRQSFLSETDEVKPDYSTSLENQGAR